LSVANFIVIIYDIGFIHSPEVVSLLGSFYSASLVVSCLALGGRLLLMPRNTIIRGARLAEYGVFGLQCMAIIGRFFLKGWLAAHAPFVRTLFLIYLLFIAVFFIELSKISLSFYRVKFNPALLYLASFLVLIAFGTGLLLLPNATVNSISFVNALFTATSAVCVTGLAVVDTATQFTTTGKVIILLLIQAGGLGVMTLTSFFGFFFQGAYSYQHQIFIKDFVNEDKIGQIFRTLFKIVVVTLLIELLGALLIYQSLDSGLFVTRVDKIQFAVFHSVSAFCNAGFSTLSAGLFDPNFRYQYNFQLIIAGLIILGGIGFPVIFNLYQYFTNRIRSRISGLLNQPLTPAFSPEVSTRTLHVNTKLILVTTGLLLLLGTVLFYITERSYALAGRSAYGQFVTAFFGSVTPRTAGFNTVDMEALSRPTILFYLLFMWIGGSPGSTAGGIKTTTLAIAVLNTFSIAKSKYRLEVFKREIPSESVRRAFAVMLLSFLVVGLAVFLVALFDPGQDLIHIAFECFSAYATVGLSLNMTPDLSNASKLIIMLTMYLGRVGTLTLLVGLTRTAKNLSYRYPTETVFIS
jgi:potassium uptake TrkH family protein